VDCLVCHDSTGTYKKFPTDCGNPVYEEKKFGDKVFKPVNLKEVAQHVSRPSRKNCGACHFFGGGGDGVKHGDLDSSLSAPLKSLDVHMDKTGLNYNCQRCHTTEMHHIQGRHYSDPAANDHKAAMPKDSANRIACESCHTDRPHKKNQKMNDHTDKVACQSCHIPLFARENPTVMFWDWSKAGKKSEDGKPIDVKNKETGIAYSTMKGELHWAKNQVPEYFWYNGAMQHMKVGDKVTEINGPIQLYRVLGSPTDSNSRIAPFKVHRGIQPYDVENHLVVIPKLFGKPGTGAYWGDYDWMKASETGMKVAGLPFSGKLEFRETVTYWPLNHMVAPKEQSLKCEECHAQDGRLQKLTGFYMPGRDKSQGIDLLGWVLVAVSGIGASIHGLLRIFKR